MVVGLKVEVAAEGIERHACGIGLAVGRVAGNVGCANPDLLQEVPVDVGLVFPNIDDSLAYLSVVQGFPQGLGLYDLPS